LYYYDFEQPLTVKNNYDVLKIAYENLIIEEPYGFCDCNRSKVSSDNPSLFQTKFTLVLPLYPTVTIGPEEEKKQDSDDSDDSSSSDSYSVSKNTTRGV